LIELLLKQNYYWFAIAEVLKTEKLHPSMHTLRLAHRMDPEHRYLNRCRDYLNHYVELCREEITSERLAFLSMWGRNLYGGYISLLSINAIEPRQNERTTINNAFCSALKIFSVVAKEASSKKERLWADEQKHRFEIFKRKI